MKIHAEFSNLRRHMRNLGVVLALVLITLLEACGGKGGDSGNSNASIFIDIAGLPAGTKGDILLVGSDNTTREISVAQTISGLTPGVYAVKATPVLTGTSRFEPQQAIQTITLSSGAESRAVVTYESAGALQLALQPVITGLDQPVFLTSPSSDGRIFIVERPGRLRIFKNGVLAATPALDISARVAVDGERGFLSLAFDPQFSSNGFLYTHFNDPNGDVAVERFRISAADPNIVDPASSLRIITIPHQTFSNHNGGRLAFGLDGFLYLSVGDGGGGGDPFASGQDLNTLLGKILRIDVSGATAAQPYVIPTGNPFAGQPNRRPEIWAYGLRNPWRFSFDRTAALLYIGDVGQNVREEVDVAPAAAAGVNYGWSSMEGSLCFNVNPCNPADFTMPVLEYNHDAAGGCSIIGGFVYRGSAIPELRGRYLYSDLCSGFLRSFRYNGSTAVEQVDWNIPSVGSIYSFGEDSQGELYMLAVSNIIYKIVRQ